MRLLLVALVMLGCSSESSQRTLVVQQDGGGVGGSGGISSSDGGPVVSEFGGSCVVTGERCAEGLECTWVTMSIGRARLCVVPCDDGGAVCQENGGECIRQLPGEDPVCCPSERDCYRRDAG